MAALLERLKNYAGSQRTRRDSEKKYLLTFSDSVTFDSDCALLSQSKAGQALLDAVAFRVRSRPRPHDFKISWNASALLLSDPPLSFKLKKENFPLASIIFSIEDTGAKTFHIRILTEPKTGTMKKKLLLFSVVLIVINAASCSCEPNRERLSESDRAMLSELIDSFE